MKSMLDNCNVFLLRQDAWEDQVRRRDDFRMNNQHATIVEDPRNDAHVLKVRWKDSQSSAHVGLTRGHDEKTSRLCVTAGI